MSQDKVLLHHGSGGKQMHELIRRVILPRLSNPLLRPLADGAFLPYTDELVFSTDAFVVQPIFFPGGDIGKLSICGTVNDLLMMGAHPEYLALAFIIEEGLALPEFERVVDSIASTARKAKVTVVTGDLKVVQKGAADKIFITTSGIGRRISRGRLSAGNVEPGDSIIISGPIGNHGMAVLSCRQGLDMELRIKSDCAALTGLLLPVLRQSKGVKCMRDPTRGGIATTLNEIAAAAGVGMRIRQKDIPLLSQVGAAAELLGIDPLYLACEGNAVIIAQKKYAPGTVSLLRKHPLGRRASIVGEVCASPKGKVVLTTSVGTERIVDMLSSEPLPRIC